MRGLLHHLRLGHFITSLGFPETRELAIDAAAKSVQGSRCNTNEDCYLMDEDRGVFILADGLGGQCGGERASRLAATGLMREAELLLERPDPGRSLGEGIAQAFLNVNESILRVAEQLPRFRGMGASAVMAIVDQGRLYVGSAGDCRGYLVRGGEAERLTVDQTVSQLLIDAGFAHEIRQQQRRQRMLWNCLGHTNFAPDQVRSDAIQYADRLILVSNGVTRVVNDGMIGSLCDESENVVGAATNVVNAALSFDTTDDATCLAVSFGAASPKPR